MEKIGRTSLKKNAQKFVFRYYCSKEKFQAKLKFWNQNKRMYSTKQEFPCRSFALVSLMSQKKCIAWQIGIRCCHVAGQLCAKKGVVRDPLLEVIWGFVKSCGLNPPSQGTPSINQPNPPPHHKLINLQLVRNYFLSWLPMCMWLQIADFVLHPFLVQKKANCYGFVGKLGVGSWFGTNWRSCYHDLPALIPMPLACWERSGEALFPIT